jgi:hypothetical protein
VLSTLAAFTVGGALLAAMIAPSTEHLPWEVVALFAAQGAIVAAEKLLARKAAPPRAVSLGLWVLAAAVFCAFASRFFSLLDQVLL